MRDESLFLFSHSLYKSRHPLLADSPACFCSEKSSCSVCPGGTRTFPDSISYRQLIRAQNWIVQAHEQIWATVTSSQQEVSTTLELLDYEAVSDKLIFFEDRRESPVSHVAVLSHTMDNHWNGALCLLLYSPLKWEEAVRLTPCFYPVCGISPRNFVQNVFLSVLQIDFPTSRRHGVALLVLLLPASLLWSDAGEPGAS